MIGESVERRCLGFWSHLCSSPLLSSSYWSLDSLSASVSDQTTIQVSDYLVLDRLYLLQVDLACSLLTSLPSTCSSLYDDDDDDDDCNVLIIILYTVISANMLIYVNKNYAAQNHNKVIGWCEQSQLTACKNAWPTALMHLLVLVICYDANLSIRRPYCNVNCWLVNMLFFIIMLMSQLR